MSDGDAPHLVLRVGNQAVAVPVAAVIEYWMSLPDTADSESPIA